MASQSIWQIDPRLWPKAARQYVFLAAAFQEIGQALCGDEWTGREALPFPTPLADGQRKVAALLTRAPAPPVNIATRQAPLARGRAVAALNLPKYTPQQMEEIERRRTEALEAERASGEAMAARKLRVVDWIAERSRNGELVTFGLLSGREPVLLGPSVWNVANDWALFETCTVKRWLPGMTGAAEYYLFLTRESLDHCLKREGGPQVGKITAERKAEAWLREQFADSATEGMSKDEFKRSARQRFDALSAKAFDRAWGNATAEHPERTRAGAKKKLGR